MTAVTLDPERQKQARQYARLKRRMWLVDLIVSLLILLAWLAFGWAVTLRDRLAALSAAPWAIVLGIMAVFFLSTYVLKLPLGYYTEFVLPHRFGQSTQTRKGWAGDQVKMLLISLPFELIEISILYAFLRAFPQTWWLWAAGVFLLFTVVLVNLAPVLIMPLFNKFVPLGEEHADLAQRLMNLAARAKTRVRGVYKFDMSRRTRAANAALTGLGNTRRIVLGDTLINEFTPDEIEVVLAHELAHHVHRDMPLLIAAQSALTLGGLYLASLALQSGTAWLGLAGPADPAGLPLLLLILRLYSLVVEPLGKAFSRWRERLADRYALRVTANPSAFESAFIRLANQNLGEVDPERWVVWLFYDHPPLGERIAMARQSA